MPHNEHRKKTHRKAERARERNRQTRATMKTAIKRVHAAADPKESVAAFSEAQQKLDKAAKAGTIHRNKAARIKSRLSRAVKRA